MSKVYVVVKMWNGLVDDVSVHRKEPQGLTLIDEDGDNGNFIYHTKIDESNYTGENKFEFELPNSKRTIEFKLLTQKDEIEIQATIKSLEKVEKLTGVSSAQTTRFKQQILSVDGEQDIKFINNFVDNEFLAMDSREFRAYALSITPDIEMKFDYTSQTGNIHKLDIPLRVEFFWPAGN